MFTLFHRFTGVHARCRKVRSLFLSLAVSSSPWLWSGAVLADDKPAFDSKEDVIYSRKLGSALTMDVFTPKANANGAAPIRN
jgi:hypothetical protein